MDVVKTTDVAGGDGGANDGAGDAVVVHFSYDDGAVGVDGFNVADVAIIASGGLEDGTWGGVVVNGIAQAGGAGGPSVGVA